MADERVEVKIPSMSETVVDITFTVTGGTAQERADVNCESGG